MARLYASQSRREDSFFSRTARGLFAVGGVAFVAVTPDHGVRLVHQPIALDNAVAQLCLIFLQLAILPFAPLDALLLFEDEVFLPTALNELSRPMIQISFAELREPTGLAYGADLPAGVPHVTRRAVGVIAGPFDCFLMIAGKNVF